MTSSLPPARAVLLCAGLGERLRPLTLDRAKPSLPLMNRPLILHALERLLRGGIREVAVNLHHAPGSLTGIVAGSSDRLPEVTWSPEERILGTAGGVVAALGRLGGGGPLLVANGDALSDLDLSRLADRHRRAADAIGAVATLAVRPRGPSDPYTPVWVDPDGWVCGIGEAGPRGAPHVFLGVQILGQEALDMLPPGGPSDLVKDLYAPLLRSGRRLGAHRHDGWWIEIGSPRLYLAAHLALLADDDFLTGLDGTAGRLVPGESRVFAAPGAAGLDAARVEETVVGDESVVGAGSSVRRSLLGRRSIVGEGARVEASIVWEGARVEAGSTVRGSLIWSEGGAIRLEALR